MRKYDLELANGDRYYIHDNGDIERTDIPGFHPSKNWKLVSLQLYNNFHRMTGGCHFHNLDAYLPRVEKWFGHNIHYYVVDIDHGTMRYWIDPKRRIKSLRRIV